MPYIMHPHRASGASILFSLYCEYCPARNFPSRFCRRFSVPAVPLQNSSIPKRLTDLPSCASGVSESSRERRSWPSGRRRDRQSSRTAEKKGVSLGVGGQKMVLFSNDDKRETWFPSITGWPLSAWTWHCCRMLWVRSATPHPFWDFVYVT
ncbi:hypothetical protein VTO42DRAFT_6307 [Malbranchea cinnamomea]